jgi:hypothetical protein
LKQTITIDGRLPALFIHMEVVARSNNFYSKCLVCDASDKNQPHLKFFRLSSTEPERSNWLTALGLQEQKLPKNPIICNQHCLSIPLNGRAKCAPDASPKKKLFHVVRNKSGKHFCVDINSEESAKQAIKIYTFENMTNTAEDTNVTEEKMSKRSSTEEMEMPSMDLDDMMAEIYHHDEGDVSEVEHDKEDNEEFGGNEDETEAEPDPLECVTSK